MISYLFVLLWRPLIYVPFWHLSPCTHIREGKCRWQLWQDSLFSHLPQRWAHSRPYASLLQTTYVKCKTIEFNVHQINKLNIINRMSHDVFIFTQQVVCFLSPSLCDIALDKNHILLQIMTYYFYHMFYYCF